MGQHLSNVNSLIVEWINKDESVLSSDSIISGNGKEDINLFLSMKTCADATTNQIFNSEKILTKQIQNYLFTLTKANEFTEINAKVNKLLMENGFASVTDRYQKALQEIKAIFTKQQQLRKSLTKKLDDDNQSIFSETSTKESDDQQFSYFTIQLLTSLLLMSIKINEQIDPSITLQIIILARQLCEQIPIKSLCYFQQSSNSNSLMFKSLKPLIDYINQLSLSTDQILATQALQILLKFSIAQASFKDLLPIINKLIFNTTNIYNLQHLFIQMNNCLAQTIKQLETESQSNADLSEDNQNDATSKKTITEELSFISLDYLKSNGIFPNTKLAELDEKQFNGQFISSIILSHIDIYNQINLNKQFNDGNIHSSISFEFHPNTFKQLFYIIEQLPMTITQNPTLNHIRIVFIKLFKTHLQFLSKISKQLLANTDEESSQDSVDIDLTLFANDDELQKWFDLLLRLTYDDDNVTIRTEASQALIYLIDLKTRSFTEKLSVIHKYIIENKSKILIEQLFIQLNQTETLFNWIEILCQNKSEEHELYSFIDIYLDQTNDDLNEQRIKQLLQSFQQFFLVRLLPQSKLNDKNSASVFAKYISYIFKSKRTNDELINEILLGLCFMTQTDIFPFDIVQPIFISIFPLLSEYILQCTNNIYSLYWLIGKMSYIMIIGQPINSLEIKHIDKLKSVLFSGGCETTIIENNTNLNQESLSDDQLLMSIYNNIDQGKQLISKMKIYVKARQHILKSIEEYVDLSCAALFAVYIKHYRRINIAKLELSKRDDQQPHTKLLSLYEYANQIQTLFITNKAQGQDCEQIYKQIKIKTLFLLSTVKQSYFIQDDETILHQQIYSFVSNHFHENESESDELTQCLIRQYQRGINRLITYEFIHLFIQKIFKIEQKNVLTLFLLFLRKENVNWFYLEDIQAINYQLKEQIRKNYYLIIKTVLTFILQSNIFEPNIFYLLNLSYKSEDFPLLYHHQLIEILFKTYITFIEQGDQMISVKNKLIAYNWFRLYLLKLCRNTQNEKQQDFIFNTLILNELKGLRQLKIDDKDNIIDSIECRNHSLDNSSIGWFLYSTINKTSKVEIELCRNQWLIILLRCVHFYEHIRSLCGTIDFIEELLYIYRNSQNRATILLALKILGHLLPSLTQNIMIKDLLNEFLFSIGDSSVTSEIVTQLIYIYRTIMSTKSSCQFMATQLVFDSIISTLNTMDWKSLETVEKKEWNYLLASLYILGGYIEPYSLGSIVNVHTDKENNECELGIIIDIDRNDRGSYYLVQYLQENQTELIIIDILEIKVDVPPANLLALPNINDSNLSIHSLLDSLGSIIQIDTSDKNSLRLLQLKRYCITTLYQILDQNSIIDIFLQKPYAPFIGQLSMTDAFEQNGFDLHLLDRCEQWKQKLINNPNDANQRINHGIDNKFQIQQNQSMIYNGWKPYASRAEIEIYKKGRNGNDEISIVPFPSHVAEMGVIQECGDKHRFKGRIYLDNQHRFERFPSFIVENLSLSEGNWYYCVKLPLGGLVQIGWATTGFMPQGREGLGIGDDGYSWSFDGSRGTIYSDQEFRFLPENVRWKANDVCGCGIEINGENTQIKYWLNGKFLGTAFSHQSNIASTTVKCDLLPNGPNTIFFPGVTVQSHTTDDDIFLIQVGSTTCELIISPEDMTECPLPDGYKPILMPKLSRNTESFVAYPYSAYLVGDDLQDFIYSPRNTPSTRFLRDFINEHHMETTLNIHHHQLKLTEESDGFPFLIDNQTFSFTISFDFEILTKSTDNSDILLFTLQTIEQHSVRIPFNKNNEPTKTVILFHPQEREIKIYLNNNTISQILNVQFDHQTMTTFNFHFLPKISVGIKNFAVWKYALDEEHIGRLFLSGLSYVAIDYKQQNQYRLEANTFTFTINQQYFTNEFLLPFDQPFDETKWKQKQNQIDIDESKFFKTLNQTNESILQFYGNKTYLVIKKSSQEWNTYTIILDILIPDFPTDGERLVLVLLNLETNIFITSTGQICLTTPEDTSESETILKLNQFIRLLITVDKTLIKIYADGSLILNANLDNNSLTLAPNRIHLFRQIDLDHNTTNDNTLRIQCKSITFRNRSIQTADLDEILTSPKYSLETLVAPSFLINVSSLINIGYKIEWIKYVMKRYKTNNIQLIDTIIREHKEEISKIDLQRQKHRYLNMFLRLGSAIDKQKLENLINTNDQLETICELFLTHWNDLQTFQSLNGTDQLELNSNFAEWIRDKSTSTVENDTDYQLLDLSKSEEHQRRKVKTSIDYSHKDISYKQYIDSIINCEYRLISKYARHTMLNIFTIWSNTNSHRFPLEIFGDYTSIIKLLRSINDTFIVKSILKNEIKSFIENPTNKVSLLYHLQKNIIMESIEFLSKISLLTDESDNKTTIIEEQTKNEEMNLNFILKILNIFVELLNDKSTIDTLISYLFPEPIINLMFDLFLILPTHQSKIFILHLFSSLMQTSVNFRLNERIENFMSQLLIELLSNAAAQNNQTIKALQTIVMDFVYLDLSRQKSQQFEIKLSELPQNFQDLCTVVDIINAITDQTKETQYPDLLFVEAYNILDETLVFTLDDITASNYCFDVRSDLELINLMNNDALIEHSFSEFIHSLAVTYELYPSLLNIPADCVQNRAKLFHILEASVEKILSLVDLTFAPGKSFLVDKIRIAKNYLLSRKKMAWFQQSLDETTTTSQSVSHSRIQFDFLRATTNDNNGQNTTFNQGYEQLHENAHVLFRSDIERLWRAHYVGMHSTDHGGPYRDSITSMCYDICSTRLPLFILCPNGRTNSGLNRDQWIPNVFSPNQQIPGKIKKQYRFVGQLMGMAIRRKHFLDFKFPSLLWKQLVGEQITIKDIELIDIQSFVIIKEMENNLEKSQSVESEFRFDIVSSAGHTYELISGGKDIPITAENFKEYCSRYVEYRLNEFHRQIEYIRQGLCSVVPNHFLNLLTDSELEETVCGKIRIDVQLLKRNTQYNNSSLESPYIERFWKVLSEMFNEEQKKLFLKFVWGRNTLPNRDEDFTEKFSIHLLMRDECEADRMLPRSHTCSFALHLPSYSTTEIMYERLNYSITHCSSIDADG